jgi:putative redox protein
MIVEWKGGMAFEAANEDGIRFTMDSHPDHGGEGRGVSPVEALLSAAAACSAMDVISILEKKQQKVTSYRIEVSGERTEEGVYPRPFKSVTIRHIVSGEGIDEAAVARSVQLSDEKYCSVVATLRAAPRVTSEFAIEPA